jgi:hypothetical protein
VCRSRACSTNVFNAVSSCGTVKAGTPGYMGRQTHAGIKCRRTDGWSRWALRSRPTFMMPAFCLAIEGKSGPKIETCSRPEEHPHKCTHGGKD